MNFKNWDKGMPRKKRVSRAYMCHHVMLRGIDGRATFLNDSDRVRFCLLLQEATELHSFKVHAFCLMTNHVHLLLEPTDRPLSTGVHRFASRYAQHFNKKHKRRGYVFQGRFRSILVEDGTYLRRLVRYIHLNPVDAKMCKLPDQYPWSSYKAYVGREVYTWLSMKRVLSYFGKNRLEALDNMASHIEEKIDANLDSKDIQKAFRIGVYGSEEFEEIYADNDEENIVEKEIEQKQVTVGQLVDEVCSRCKVNLDELRSSDKRRELVNARKVLARSAQLIGGLNLRDVCELLDKHHGSVSRLAVSGRMKEELNNLACQISDTFS